MWAALARKAKDIEPPPVDAPPLQIVVARDTTAAAVDLPTNTDLTNLQQRTVIDLPVEVNKGLLVLDANAFIKGLDDFLDVADCFVTVSQVIKEVRDRAARDLLDRLPVKLHVLEPTPESMLEVMDMAAKTGDDGVMSRTDVRLCALAVDCCIAKNCLGARIAPRAPIVNPRSNEVVTVEDEQPASPTDEGQDEEDGNEEGSDNGNSSGADAPVEVEAAVAPEATANTTKRVADEGEWITPDNIATVINGSAVHGAVRFHGGAACVTSDFAMQNVLMHLGVPIVGTRGMQIKELRQWLLRCHACYRLVSDTTRQFCPDCGSGDTLRRVSYIVNDKGEKKLFINFSRQLSTRGTVFNLPKARGGRKGTNRMLVLREDQLAHVMRGQQSASRQAQLDQALDDEDDLAVFGQQMRHKKFDVNAPRQQSSYKKFNVNEQKKARAGRRK